MDNVCELSIEETNKLREKLGLKKLEIKEDNNEKVVDEKSNFINNDLSYKNEKLKKKNNGEIKKKKIINNKKDLEEKNKIKSISEDYNDDINDVETWINKTRNTMNKRLAQESIQYSDDEEETKKKKKKKNNNNNFVSCVKVEHKNEDITDNMILTLKDKSVLDDEKDCLINEELKKNNMKHLISRNDETYWNKNYYDPLSYYDDNNKMVEGESSINMIPKYDDEKHSFDINVHYDENKDVPYEKVIKKQEVLKKGNNEREEKETPRKDEKNNLDNILKLKKKKIKNIRKRKKDSWDFLYNEKEEDENGKMESKEKESESKESEIKKKQSTHIIDDVIKKIREEQMDMDFNYFDDVFSENEEDKELYELLQKGNNLKKAKKESNYQSELLKYIVINDEEKKTKDKENDNFIKLTNASEFCKNISLPRDLHENEKKIKSKKNEKDLTNEDFLSSKNILKENINEDILKNTYENEEIIKNKEENREQKNNKSDYDEHQYDEISAGGVSKIFNEVELDEGLCGALKYLKTKGELNIEDKIYRNPENKPLHMSTEKNDIKLDYKNELGKVMTPKETFRYISWIFHGKKQGKNKLEKKIKRLEIERRFKENPMDSLPTLNVLKKYQQIQKKSYFTLSSNN
ncbi:U4/U6.U5 tri-snRNP-associated protein 1, putative [Plasmodium relictum]|uniref:U4/U6.U5 tri-snRNP-associated protein 1, putative n=1 Tax=Plasmodium relictum TaxID=85471 RepID=A0A1J1H7Z5_PLARL|nr:U4/U6.U5 tri-snRNP-associated protein 1, putative [Plasmodium relictum]CRG99717.1 U4/U6.U5 tri-snRNP-associated protein 1, putative [Plasmodium relictum]